MDTSKIFWKLTITVFLGLLVPTLVQNGMFLDGVTYSTISKNMANGLGSFWDPHYTQTLYPHFYEHPPMVFIVQSYFFKLLGDGIYTERIFTLFTAILTAVGIVLCWRLFSRQFDLKKYAWLPVLLWITIPIIFWSYKNNLLENTMGVFSIFSVYFIAKSLGGKQIAWLVPGSICIVMAFFAKGFVGLFPLAVPICFSIVFKPKNYSQTIVKFIVLFLLSFSLFYLVMIVFPESKRNLFSYFEKQLIPALSGQREVTTNNRLAILVNLVIELILPLAILGIFAIRSWIKKPNPTVPTHREFLFFLLVAVSASIPLIISLKQRKFYLVPSIPFYAISISFLIAPYLQAAFETLSATIKGSMTKTIYLILGIVVLFSILRFGGYSRNKEQLKDVYVISQTVPPGTIIATTEDLCQNWGLIAYLGRTAYIGLDCGNDHAYFLVNKNAPPPPRLIENYEAMELDLLHYTLLERKYYE